MSKPIYLSILSAILLSLGWLIGGGIFLLIAFVPILWLQDNLSTQTNKKGKPKKILPYVALTFALWNAATTWWVGIAFLPGAILATLIGTLLMGGAFMIYHCVWKRAPRALAYTVLVTAWIGYEYLYLTGEISFPWLILGNGFANNIKLVQWYEYTGVFGGSLWVLLSNLLIFNAVKYRSSLPRWILSGVIVILPIAISMTMYYTYTEPNEPKVVQVIQPNIDSYEEKFILSQEEQTTIITDLMLTAPNNVNFIVAPETAINEHLWEPIGLYNPAYQSLKEVIDDHYPRAVIIIGASTYRQYTSLSSASQTARLDPHSGVIYDIYNSAFSVDSSDVVNIHHKSILVVGPEKLPYYNVLKNFDFLTVDLGGISGQLGVDSTQMIFPTTEGTKVATAICYESIYGEYFSLFTRADKGAQLMFVITNDGWWGNTAGHRQHFSYSRLRAIETRRSIARSANTGISGFINQRGDVLETLGWDQRGAITQTLNLNSKVTFYSSYGDYIARLSWYIFALSMLYFLAYSVRKKNHLV